MRDTGRDLSEFAFGTKQHADTRAAFVVSAREEGTLDALTTNEQKILLRALVSDAVERVRNGRAASVEALHTVDVIFPEERDPSVPASDIADTFTELLPELLISDQKEEAELAHEFMNVIHQHANLIKPDVYLHTLGVILRQPGIDAQDSGAAYFAFAEQQNRFLPVIEHQLSRLNTLDVEEGASILTLLSTAVQHRDRLGFSEPSLSHIERLLKMFPEHARSALLKRKAEAIVRRLEQGGPSPVPESSDRLVETLRGQHVERPLVPIARDYFGLPEFDGRIRSLVYREGSSGTYTRTDVRPLEQLQSLAVQPWMNAEERTHALQAQRDYEMLLDHEFLDGIEQDYGFPVRALTLREQRWFVASLRDLSPENESKVMNFTRTFGLDGARAFLSVEQDGTFRDAVLRIGERVPAEQARALFARYAELSLLAQGTVEELVSLFLDSDRANMDPALVEQELLRRAKGLLEQVSKPGARPEEILSAIASAKAETVLFGSVCKTYFSERRDARLEDIRGLRMETVRAGAVSKADQVEMERMIRANWGKSSPAAVEARAHDLRWHLEHPTSGTRFYLLRKEGRPLGFLGMTQGGLYAPDGVYADFFNVDPELNRSGLGGAMAKEVLAEEAIKHPVYAHVDPSSPALRMYLGFGFEQIGSDLEMLPDGTTFTWTKLRLTQRPSEERLAA